MFTHVFQFFLVVCTLGVVMVAITTSRMDKQETRANRIAFYKEAVQFAGNFVARRTSEGYYDRNPDADAREDYHALRENYIRSYKV